MSNTVKTILKAIGRALLALPRFLAKCFTFVRTHTWAETKEASHRFRGRMKERRSKLKADMRRKHRFVVMDSETFREKWSFQLTGINLFVTVGVAAIVLVVLTSLLIAFTSLREFIPGYMRSDIMEQAYENTRMLDSLEHVLQQQEAQLQNIKMVIGGEQMPTEDQYRHKTDSSAKAKPGEYTHSKADSLLRDEVENADQYQVKPSKINKLATGQNSVSSAADAATRTTTQLPFFTPLQGKVLRSFSEKDKHLGTDVAGVENSVVKSIYSGTVLLANYTPESGYIVVIQHPNNYISVYKHCGSLLKRAGDAVRAGEPVAFLGSTGATKGDPHLHFELWYNGKPINPQSYVNF